LLYHITSLTDGRRTHKVDLKSRTNPTEWNVPSSHYVVIGLFNLTEYELIKLTKSQE